MKEREDVQKVPKDKYKVMSSAEVGMRLTTQMLDELAHDEFEDSHGIACVEFKVLVKPKKAEDKTKGGIHLPDQTVERDQHAAMEGVIAGMSPFAFTYEEWPLTARKPEIGDTVVFARYSGITQRGNDGVEYRIMNDKDIVAIRRAAR